jgi:hypothetical protein
MMTSALAVASQQKWKWNLEDPRARSKQKTISKTAVVISKLASDPKLQSIPFICDLLPQLLFLKMSAHGKRYATLPHEEVDIVVAKSGFASKTPKTVIECLMKTVEKHGNEKALCLRRPVNVSSSLPRDLL